MPPSEEVPLRFAETTEHLDWLSIARAVYQASDDWFSTSLRVMLERSLSNFRGVHPPGSKYHQEQYLKKSRLFRPKTRGAIRRGEAGHAIAFFSTQDIVHCTARDETDERQLLAAEIHNELVNERLNDPMQHWFKTLIGGAQDAMTIGTVISKQCWDFEMAEVEVDYEYEELDIEGRTIVQQERAMESRVLVDRPSCKIIPIENFRLDPAADWLDPVNSSPYLIEMQPTYIYVIQERISKGKYLPVARDLMGAAIHQDWDSIRKAREGGARLDKYDNDSSVRDHMIAWVHHHIVHRWGVDWVYDTLGTEIMLSKEPIPIEDYYAHSHTYNRPYVMGNAIIEAHKNYPGGIPQLIEDLQEEANDIANLRIDNVRAALNPRWIVRRGSGVDARGLIRNVHSGVTYATNVANDIRELRAQDVTRSAYEEQNRIDLDIDGVIGTFSGSSIQANRSVGETVGGMNLLSADANKLEEYLIRTVTETWVEGVMRQFVAMEAAYESDDRILSVVASRLKTDVDTVLDVIREPINVRCNVGFNATNPQKRIEKLSIGLATISAYMPDVIAELDRREVVKEVFGAIGHKDGSRFFPGLYDEEQDPRIVALEQQIQQLQQLLQPKLLESQTKVEVANIGAETKRFEIITKNDLEMLKLRHSTTQLALQSRLDQVDAQLKIEESDRKRRELYLAREALSHEIQESNRRFNLEVAKLRQQDQSEKRELKAKGGEKGAPKTNGKGGPSAMAIPGTAGVMARDQFGMVPGKSDGIAPP
jgi:hypothetical protein